MKITGSSPIGAVGTVTASVPPTPASTETAPGSLQSDVFKPALDALAALPDVDAARVAALRTALARGELPFDPARLAGLVQKFHGRC